MSIRVTASRALAGALSVLALLALSIGVSRSTGSRQAALFTRADLPALEDEGQNRVTPAGYGAFQRSFPRSFIPPNAYFRGVRQARTMADEPPETAAWQEVGPYAAPAAGTANPLSGARSAVSGRVTALAADPNTCTRSGCGTVYLGTGGGGVWKTTNGGSSWKPVMENQPNLTIGALALDPANPGIVYAGTGEAPGYGAHGIGILRSLDAGQTWVLIGGDQFRNRAVSNIVVDPRGAGGLRATLYVTTTLATSGGAATGGDDLASNPYLPAVGFYLSKDGGASWSLSNPAGARNAPHLGVPAGGLALDPADPTVLYAGFTADGVYESNDDGLHWTALTNGLLRSGFHEIALGVAPSASDVVYAAYNVDDSRSGHEAMFRSQDGGATWARLNTAPDACGDQCSYNLALTVDPSDSQTVYATGSANYDFFQQTRLSPCRTLLYPLPTGCSTALTKSADGGRTWADVAENAKGAPIHPDAHVVLVDPKNPAILYAGTDGGIFRSSDGGTHWFDLNKGLRTFQVQALAVDDTGSIYIGTQDNGTFLYTPSANKWTHVNDGDGGNALTDPQAARFSYNSVFGATLFRNDNHGASYRNTFISPFWPDFTRQHRGTFYEPYAVASSRSNVLFFGTYRLWRSQMRGGTDGNHDGSAVNDRSDRTDWVPISFDLSCASQPPAPGKLCASGDNLYLGISAVAVSPVDPNVVAAATSNGEVWLTTNALAPVQTDTGCDPRGNGGASSCNFVSGVRWSRIDTQLPDRFITSLHFAPGSSTTLFATLSGFDENTPSTPGHVFMTADRGGHWRNLNGFFLPFSLPNLPFNDIVINPHNGHLYAAADYGLYVSADNGVSWMRADTGLPAVPIYQMQFYTVKGKLIVATFGRGVWETTAP